jgi:hypothetical protein
MRILKAWMSGLAMMSLALPGIAQETMAPEEAAAEDEKAWSLYVALDYASLYMFRGIDLLGDDPVLNPYAIFAYGGFSAWTYIYRGDFGSEGLYPEGTDYGEIDFGLDYTWGLGAEDAHSLTVGALRYTYSDPADYNEIETTELYGIFGCGTFLSPTISLYYDVDVYDAGYLSLGVSHSWPIGEQASFDAKAILGYDLGYNSTVYLGDEQNDLSDLLLGIDIPWSVAGGFGLHAAVNHSVALGVVDDYGQEDETWFVVGANYSF